MTLPLFSDHDIARVIRLLQFNHPSALKALKLTQISIKMAYRSRISCFQLIFSNWLLNAALPPILAVKWKYECWLLHPDPKIHFYLSQSSILRVLDSLWEHSRKATHCTEFGCKPIRGSLLSQLCHIQKTCVSSVILVLYSHLSTNSAEAYTTVPG